MNFTCHNLVTEKTKVCQLTIPSPAIVNLHQINVCQMFVILGKACQLTMKLLHQINVCQMFVILGKVCQLTMKLLHQINVCQMFVILGKVC